MTATRPRLSRADWTDAALAAMAAAGTTGVNVEQLARSLGATKGSFYHHFADRGALVTAALERFGEIVEGDLAAAEAIEDPRRRLVEVAVAGLGTGLDGFVDVALSASATDPEIAATLDEITARRLDWLVATLGEAGLDDATARFRAEAGLATYLGLFHLQRAQGRRFGEPELRAHIMRAVDGMLA